MKRFLYLLEVILITALAADFYFFPSSSASTVPSSSVPPSVRHAQQTIPRAIPSSAARSLASEESKPIAVNKDPRKRLASWAAKPAMPLEPMPETAPREEEPEPFAPRSQFDLSLGGEYFSIKAKDLSTNASAQILSKFSPTVSATWKLRFTETYASLLGVSLRKDTIEPFAGTSKRIQGNGTAARFYAGAERSKSGGRSRILLGQEDTLYTRAQNAQTIELTRVATPYLSLEHAQEVFRHQTAAGGIGAKVSAHGPASSTDFRAKSGYGGKLFLFLSHEMPAMCLRGELFYSQRKADSSIAKQNMSATGIGLTIEWGKP